LKALSIAFFALLVFSVWRLPVKNMGRLKNFGLFF
jgi:hypothetical protein